MLKLIESEAVSWTLSVKATRHNSIELQSFLRFNKDHRSNLSNIEASLTEIERMIYKVCQDLNKYLFRSLRTEYEYLTCRETIIETILANAYHFTERGKLESI